MSLDPNPMLNVIVLAAGQGTRMQSVRPKVLHPLAGKPLLAHVLDHARALLPARIVIVVGHAAEQVRTAFADQADVHFVHQAEQLGTAHAVQQALPVLDDAPPAAVSLILYGDVPLVQSQTLQRLLQSCGTGMALLTQSLADPTGYGRIVRDTQGHVLRIVEHKDATEAERAIAEINTGILAAPTAKLKDWLARVNNQNTQNEYYLTDVIALAVGDGVPVQTAQPEHAWEPLGVNSRAQQAALERVWQGEQAQRLLAQGVTLADPARFDLRGTLQCGRDVFIDVGCVFEGQVVLGDGVHVGPHCVIADAHIGAGAHIQAFSHVQRATIGENAQIGPYARLRPGADVGPQAHVGNFVEIKNTRLGAGAKANHLAYVGDATVGMRVNIGAGVITCNYDGVNKHRTVIEDDAFIGSDTQLVAPVRVGQGATIGAGTTLTRDAPAQQLTLARAPQASVATWKRPVKAGAEPVARPVGATGTHAAHPKR